MDITAVIIYTIFLCGLIWYSYQIWFNHEAFLSGVKSFRSGFYKTILGRISEKVYGHILDNDPELELWLARIGLIFIYALILYLIFR